MPTIIELTPEELEAFASIYEDQALYEYLSYNEDIEELESSPYLSLFIKLGIDV